jgi:7-carboxy-7-deazaguanine synthase
MSSTVDFNTHLPVREVFGPTWQGEGPHAGKRAHFVRLGHCNLSCEWCDTPETWDTSRYDLDETITERPWEDVLADLAGASMVVLTGGEPMMHQRRGALVSLLGALRVPVHVETNGTIAPNGDMLRAVDHFTVSPKHATTSDPEKKRLKPGPLSIFAQLAREQTLPPYEFGGEKTGVCFKFVCRDAAEVAAVDDVVEHFELPREHVWVMPEGTTAAQIVDAGQAIAQLALEAGFNFSTRMHTLLWNDEKGR